LRPRSRARFVVAVWLAAPATSLLAGQPADGVQFAIGPGPVGPALLEFGTEARLNVKYPSQDLDDLRTKGVNGFMQPKDALERLLSGLPLCQTFNRSGKTVRVNLCRNLEREPRIEGRAFAKGARSADFRTAARGTLEPAPGPDVVVLGTQIDGVQPIGVVPTTLTKMDFDRLGVTTIADLFARLPQVFGGGPAMNLRKVGSEAQSNAGLGAGINVLGQGAGATLILINGRRFAFGGDRGLFTDVANIPLSMVKSVDVLADGASAIYGSDAVGGVINIVLLDGSEDPETSAQVGALTEGAYSESRISQSFGKHWLSNQPLSGQAVLALEYSKHSRLGPSQAAGGYPVVRSDLLPGQQLDAAYLHLEESVMDGTSLTAEGVVSRRRATAQYSDAIADPAAAEPVVARNSAVTVQTAYVSTRSSTRVGEAGSLSLALSRAVETERQRTSQILLNGAAGGQPEAAAQTTSPTWFRAFSRIDEATIKLNGPLITIPAGEINGVIGSEYRQQIFSPSNSSDAPGIRNQYARRVPAVFGELTLPVAGKAWTLPGLRNLDIGIAARYERYSDFGHSTAPQLGVRWVPGGGFEIKGTWGRSLQAPNPLDLDESQNTVVATSMPDSQSPTGRSDVLVTSGNNSALKEQTAITRSANVRFTWPSTGPVSLVAAMNYFDILFYHRVEAPDLGGLSLDGDGYGSFITRNPSKALQRQLCSSNQFFGVESSCLASNFAAVVDVRLHNDDTLQTRGLGFSGALDIKPEWGDIRVDLYGIYLLKYSQIATADSVPLPLLNTLYHPLRLQVHGLLGVSFGNLEISSAVNFSNSYNDNLSEPTRPIASWTTVDTRWTYHVNADPGSWWYKTSFSLSALNLFNHGPPFVAPHLEDQGYDAENASPLGRVVSLGIKKSW